MAKMELTTLELDESSKLLKVLEELNLKEISFEGFDLRDSNGDVFGRVLADYGDLRLSIQEYQDA